MQTGFKISVLFQVFQKLWAC